MSLEYWLGRKVWMREVKAECYTCGCGSVSWCLRVDGKVECKLSGTF